MERTFVQPVMPREINLGVPQWIVVTPDNWEEQLERIERAGRRSTFSSYDSTRL